MDTTERIRTAIERGVMAMSRRASLGQGTGVSRACIRDGLVCEIEDGPWRLTADLGRSAGGTETGPTPGVFGRAALGSCLAIGYAMWAAKLGVSLRGVEVEVQADYDARGQYAVADVPPGYSQVRYTVYVESDAPEEEIMRVLDMADCHSPYLDVFRNTNDVRREVQITTAARI